MAFFSTKEGQGSKSDQDLWKRGAGIFLIQKQLAHWESRAFQN